MARYISYNFHEKDNKRIHFEPLETQNPTGLRLRLYYMNKKNIKRDLIIAPRGSSFFSYGVQEDAFNKTQNSTNYNMCLFISVENKKVQDFCSSFDSIYERCTDYLFEKRKELGIKVNDKESLKKIFKYPLFEVNKEKSKNKEFRLYPKLIIKHEDSKVSKIWTKFFEKTEDEEIVQCDLESIKMEKDKHKRIKVYPAILIDSLYIARPNTVHTQISLQCKLSEAIIERIPNKDKPSLKIFNPSNDKETGDDEDSDDSNYENENEYNISDSDKD